MKTTLIALLFLFPPIETISIKPTHHQTNWTIRYEFKSNDLCYISINKLNCFITGDLWNTSNHTNKIKLKNLHLFMKDYDKNYKYTTDVCGAGNHKRFEVKIENEQGREVDELILTKGDRFYIVLSIRHHHEPESNYDILQGYLDIRLEIGHKIFNKYIVLAQQHKITPKKLTIEPPQPHYLTTQLFRTPPNAIFLSPIINDSSIDNVYWTNVNEVFPNSKIKICFYYYLSAQYKSELEFYLCTYDINGIPDDGKPTVLTRKFNGWHKYEKTLIVPKNVSKLGLKFEVEKGIVVIDDVSLTLQGLNP